jgi:hypothetical protein
MAVPTFSSTARGRLKHAPSPDFLQRANRWIGGQDDAATITPVSTIRTTPRDELLTPKARYSGAAVPTADRYLYPINHYLIIGIG